MKFYPLQKGGGARKSLRHAEGGSTKSFEVVITRELGVLAMLNRGGGRTKF